jgi:hypothetical protein
MNQNGFCEQCGAELEAGSKFCEQCGAPTPKDETASPTPLHPPIPQHPIPPPTSHPVQVQKTRSLSLWMIILAIVFCLSMLCGLLVFVLGSGWFSPTSASPATTAANPQPVVSSQAVIVTNPVPTKVVPPTLIPATLLPPEFIPTALATQTEPATAQEQAGARDLTSFYDDFSSNINTWKIVSDKSNGTAVISDGKLNLQVTKPDKYLSVQVPWYITTPVTDVTLSVTVTVQTPGLGAFGLFCRASDSKNFYMISILPTPAGGGQYRFYKDMAGKISYLTEWEDTSLLYGGEVPEEVVFSCKGNTLRLEVNGKLAKEVKDSDLKSGNAHLFALSLEDVSESNPYKITFDDFKAAMP